MPCKSDNGDICTNQDSEHYEFECPGDECPLYTYAWEHPSHCPSCAYSYGSDLCVSCKAGKPSNYKTRMQAKLDTPTTDKQSGITTPNTRIGGDSADSPKSEDFANSQDVNGNKINRGE